eukprot:Skav217196  [mRNA]  locus=scaffold557:202048:208126:- [translate_table: standard]
MGTSNPEWTYRMSKTFNRKASYIHVCMDEGGCPEFTEAALHITALELLDPTDIRIVYVGNNGKRLMKQIRDTLGREGSKGERAPRKETILPGPEEEEPSKPKKADGKTKDKERRGKGEGGPKKKAGMGDDEEKHAALRKRLESVREARKAAATPTAEEEDDSGWELTETLDLGSKRAAEKRKSALKTGSRLPEIGEDLQSMVSPGKKSGTKPIADRPEQKESTMKSSMGSSPKTVEEQLIARAVTAQGQKEERRKRDRSGRDGSRRRRYFTAVRRVLPLLEQTRQLEDEILSVWIEEQYLEGEAITTISDTLSGLHHFAPYLRGSLAKSWRLYRLWRRIEKPTQAPPLPKVFVTALINRALEMEYMDLAVTVSLGFWGLLRTGELMTLFPFQILLGAKEAILQLGATKSGLRRNQDENVVVEHLPTLLLLQTWLDIRRHEQTLTQPVYPMGPQHFRDEFRKLLQYFRLKDTFRPYSLRRGGATHDFKSHGQMERTLIRGRWSSTLAARQYIQEGLSVLVSLKISEQQAAQLQHYSTLY